MGFRACSRCWVADPVSKRRGQPRPGQRLVLFLAFRREVVDLRFVHPRRDVALFVQHPPDVNVFVALYVEDQIGVAPKAPEPQIRESQLVRISRRPRRRMASDVAVSLLERVNEPQGNLRCGIYQVVLDGLFHVPVGEFPWNDVLHGFRAAVRLTTRSRSEAKYALSAAADGLELAPASSNSRR